MKWTVVKYTLLVALVIAMAASLFYLYRKSITSEAKLKRVAEHAVMVKIQESNALYNKRFSELNGALVDVVEGQQKQITDIGKAIVALQSLVKKNVASDHTYKSGTGDPNEQYFTMINMRDADGKEFPMSWAIFKPNRPEGERWTTGVVPGWEIHSQVLLAQGKDEKDALLSVWFENQKRRDTKGNMYPLDIQEFEWVRKKIKEKSFAFNPTLTLGFVSETAEAFPVLELGAFTYGRTESDFDWRLLAGGIGGSEDLKFDFSPVQYNLGQNLPLITNLLLGPAVTFDLDLEYTVGLGVHGLF